MVIDIDTLLAWGAAFKKLSAGDVVFLEGSLSSFYYQLVSGRIRWVNIDDDGNEFIQSFVETGDCFGEIPLFDGEPYAATAVADEDAVIIRLHRPAFDALLKERPDIHMAVTKSIAAKLRYKFQFAKELLHHDPEQSISFLLSYMKRNNRNICPKCNKLNLTRKQIAGMTGFRVETVIRVIKNLQQKGQLVIDKGKVYC